MRLGIHGDGNRRLAQTMSDSGTSISGTPFPYQSSPQSQLMYRSAGYTADGSIDTAFRMVSGSPNGGKNVYAGGAVISTGGMVRQGETIFTPPSFYSPYHTASSWQIPTNRREVYRLCEYWITNEPRVAIGLLFYSDFPMNGFELVCKNRSVKKYFEKLCRKIKLEDKLPEILREYYGKGDCFVMGNLDCKHCRGTGYRDDGSECKHEGATWDSLSILNPEEVEVAPWVHVLGDEPPIYITPNNELRKIVQTGKPEEIFARLPEETKAAVRKGQPIKLNPLCVHHFKHGAPSYQQFGVSIIRPLFPTLFYRDKLRQAQWLIAERHIVPIKIVKIGTPERPASTEDISKVQEQIAQVANDPLLTIVTHHAFDYEWIGACHSSDTEVLTSNGFKLFDDVTADDLIGCYDPESGSLEFHPYTDRQRYEYDSDVDGRMVHFSGKHYEATVTPNHMMWTKKRVWDSSSNRYRNEWKKVRADEITDHDRFLVTVDEWSGNIPEQPSYSHVDQLEDVELADFLKFAGYYLSEGSVQRTASGTPCSVYIYQNKGKEVHDDIRSLMRRMFGERAKESDDDRNENVCTSFRISDSQLAKFMIEEFGHGSSQKSIPSWILGLPRAELSTFLTALVDGDGDIRFSKSGKMKGRYSTTSIVMANGVQEILFKLGYNPKMKTEKRKCDQHQDIHRIYWAGSPSDGTRVVRARNIERIDYHGFVHCFTVPTGIFVTRQNGFLSIHGNSGKVLQLTNEFDIIEGEMIDGLGLSKAIMSGEGPTYANAQVGIEVLIKRLETVRRKVATWIEEKLFKPIAEFNGFTEADERGEEDALLYPTIKWNELRLRDNTPRLQALLETRKMGDLSARTWLAENDIDLDEEAENLRLEEMAAVLSSPDLDFSGINGGMGGGYGGGGPAMPPEMGGMPPPGGAPPGAEGGMPMESAPPGGGPAPPAPPPPMPTASVLHHNYRRSQSVMDDARSKLVAASSNGRGMSRISSIYETAGVVSVLRSNDRVVTGDGYRGPLDQEPDMMTLWAGVSPSWGMPGRPIQNQFVDPRMRLLVAISEAAGRTAAAKDDVPRPKSFMTKLEGRLMQAIVSQRYPYQFWSQYLVNGDPRFRVDFAFPQLKIAVQADGEEWHSGAEDIQHDRSRDAQLASQGWIVLRFTEEEIEDKIQDVLAVLNQVMQSKSNSAGARVVAENSGGRFTRVSMA